MVRLDILSGKKAGTQWVARHFPVVIGRSSKANFQLEDAGVWDEHLRLELRPGEGFQLSTVGQALATVSGQPATQTHLRNGDTIEIGSAKLRFFLSETRQSSLRLREILTWTGIIAISVGQLIIIYWLLQT